MRFPALFALLCLVMVPLLYRLELRTAGDDLGEAADGAEVTPSSGYCLVPGPGRAVLAVATVAANPRAVSAGVIEFFLTGPRMVVSAVRQLRAVRHIRNADVARDRGTATTNLLNKDEQIADLVPTIAYLVFHRWIGARDGWQHVWLFSEARRTLTPAGR